MLQGLVLGMVLKLLDRGCLVDNTVIVVITATFVVITVIVIADIVVVVVVVIERDGLLELTAPTLFLNQHPPTLHLLTIPIHQIRTLLIHPHETPVVHR